MTDHPLAETRNVDDQVEWLDNDTVMYGLPQDAGDVNAAAVRDTGNAHPRRSGFDRDEHVVRSRRRYGDAKGSDLGRVVRHPRPRLIPSITTPIPALHSALSGNREPALASPAFSVHE